MKKTLILCLCLVLLTVMAGCGKQNTKKVTYELKATYYADGDYESYATPYLYLTEEDGTFMMGSGAVYSYAIFGTYEVKGNRLTATEENRTYTFEIRDSETLVFLEGDNPPSGFVENAVFTYSEMLT